MRVRPTASFEMCQGSMGSISGWARRHLDCWMEGSLGEDTFFFFEELPTEVQLRVLSLLTVPELCLWVAPVCRRWRLLATHPCLWNTLHLTHTSSATLPPGFLQRAPFLKELVLVNRRDAHQVLQQASRYCPLLHRLILRHCQVEGRVLREVAQGCPELRELEFGCESRLLGPDGYSSLLSFPRLRSLLLVDQRVPPIRSVLSALAGTFLCLKDLNLDGASRLRDCDLEHFLAQRRNGLVALRLDAERLGHVAFRALATCHNLQALGVSNAWRMSDAELTAVLGNVPNLTWLRLHRAFKLTARQMTAAFSLAPAVSGLMHLDLDEIPAVNDHLLHLLAFRCPKLRCLGLSRCKQVSDMGIQSITQKCSQLELLDLSWLDGVSGLTLDSLQQPATLPHLRRLNLFLCRNLQRTQLLQLCNGRPDLLLVGAAATGEMGAELAQLAHFYSLRSGSTRSVQAQLRVVFNHTFREAL